MHESARLNVFLGVRNVNAQFLPPHLAYLKSFLRTRPMNLLFPLSVTVSTVICSVLATEAAIATEPFRQAGFTFLATMMALAILEHWFLVLPVPAEAMWNWSLRSRREGEGASPKPAPHHHHDHSRPYAAVAGLVPANPE